MQKYLLSITNIFKLIDQEIIMERYFPNNVALKNKYTNPFRQDKKKGCYFAYTSKGTFIFFDHSFPEYGGDCFKVAMMNLNKGFKDTLEQINKDFNLGLKTSLNSNLTPYREDYLKRQKEKQIIPKVKKVLDKVNILKTKKWHYKVKSREWNKEDYDFWTKRYGIDLNLLNKYSISPVDHYHKRKWNEKRFKKVYSYTKNPDNPCYCYKFICDDKFSVKLYKPLTKDKQFKWETNSSNCNIQGYEQLPKKGKLLIIASSMKDLLVLVSNGYKAIAPQGEGMTIPEDKIKELKKRFKKIILCYDRDAAGLRYVKKHSKLYNCLYIKLPKLREDKENKLTDFAEYYEHFIKDNKKGKQLFKTLLKNIMKNKIKSLLKTQDFVNIELAYELGKSANIDTDSLVEELYGFLLKVHIDKTLTVKERLFKVLTLNPADVAHTYPTKNAIGFNGKELEKLLSYYSDKVNEDKFFDALKGNTCMLNEDGDVIMYHCDVSTAMKCGIENRDITFEEWD